MFPNIQTTCSNVIENGESKTTYSTGLTGFTYSSGEGRGTYEDNIFRYLG